MRPDSPKLTLERCRSRPARPVAWTRSGMTQRRASRRAPAATRPPSIEPRSRGSPRCPPAALGVSPPWTSRRATPRSPWPARNSEPARRLPSDEVRFSAGPARERSAVRSRAERASTSETLRARLRRTEALPAWKLCAWTRPTRARGARRRKGETRAARRTRGGTASPASSPGFEPRTSRTWGAGPRSRRARPAAGPRWSCGGGTSARART